MFVFSLFSQGILLGCEGYTYIMSGCLNPSTNDGGTNTTKRSLSIDDDSALISLSPKNKIPKLESQISGKTEDSSISLLNKLLDEVTDNIQEGICSNATSEGIKTTHQDNNKQSTSTASEEELCTVVDVNNKDEINALVEKDDTHLNKEETVSLTNEDKITASSADDVQVSIGNVKTDSISTEVQSISEDGDKTPHLSSSETDESGNDNNVVLDPELDLFVQCGICKDNFSEKTPLMLGCLHIFCSACILDRRYLNCQTTTQDPNQTQTKQVGTFNINNKY